MSRIKTYNIKNIKYSLLCVTKSNKMHSMPYFDKTHSYKKICLHPPSDLSHIIFLCLTSFTLTIKCNRYQFKYNKFLLESLRDFLLLLTANFNFISFHFFPILIFNKLYSNLPITIYQISNNPDLKLVKSLKIILISIVFTNDRYKCFKFGSVNNFERNSKQLLNIFSILPICISMMTTL